MKVLAYLFILCSLSAANIITPSDIEGLFTKYMLKLLSNDETQTLKQTLTLLHRPTPVSKGSLEKSSKARMSIDCIICRSAFSALATGIKNGQSDKAAADTIIALCVNLGVDNYRVCSGAVALNMPIIAHIIRTTPEASPNTFCGLLFQRATDPSFCPFNDARFEWQVDLPEKSSSAPAPPAFDAKPLKVAVITDAHIDPLYEAFGVADCDEPTCCRKGQSPARSQRSFSNDDDTLLEKSLIDDNGDLKLNLSIASQYPKQKKQKKSSSRQSAPAGYWGDYRNCDTPIWAYDDAIETIHENHRDIDVIYYVGDTIDHGIWETSYTLINDMNRYLVKKIRTTFGKNVLVVPAIGNHESQPTNQFAPVTVVGPALNTTWLYESLVNKWGYYLPAEAKKSLLQGGYFSLLVRPGLRAISLNNNVAYRDNWWLVYDPLDAKRHLDWLVQELHKAELDGEKVHILAHIPPGVHDLTYTWTREYNRIINRFSATIAAEFNGHTHSDEFKIFYSPDNIPINVAWGGGSVTSYTFYNLNYKIVTFDAQSFVPNRILNYVYNLTEANLTPNRRPHWFLLYDMQNTFRLPDLSAQSMNDLVYSMVTVNRNLLDMYAAFYSKLSDGRWPYCNDDCKIDNLCKTVVTVLWERQKCEELWSLFRS